MKKARHGSTLGELFIEYSRCKNPVTRCVLRQIIANRLDRLEAQS